MFNDEQDAHLRTLREQAEYVVKLTLGNCAMEADWTPPNEEWRESLVLKVMEQLRSKMSEESSSSTTERQAES